MDLNTGLTQALSDGTNTYIYGNGRIAQVNTDTEYFLGDALGSVRQLTDNSGAVTYASAYDPYGVTTQTYGASQTTYGYTGEYASNEMVYLRSRMYNPTSGRFTTRDSWQGDYNRPLSLNRWMYVEGNPVTYVDPTGLIKKNEAADANKIVQELKAYNVFVRVDWHSFEYYESQAIGMDCGWFEGEWTLWELQQLRKGVVDTARKIGGLNRFTFIFGYVNVENRLPRDKAAQDKAAVGIGHLLVVNSRFDNEANNWAIVHELGHVWDGNNNWNLSKNLAAFTKEYVDKGYGRTWDTIDCSKDPGKRLPGCNDDGYVYYDVLASGSNHNMNIVEDFANSFVAYVYPVDSQGRIEKYKNDPRYTKYLYYTDYTQTLRWRYIDALVKSWNELRKR